jgi:nucleotide-binding universal stress UspA family protein
MKRLLVAIDGSPASRRAVQMAAQIAMAERASVYVVHVPRTDEFNAAEDCEQAALRELAQAGVDAHLEIRGGDAADEIVAAAHSTRAGLLVMGSRGRSAVGGLLLGSVSQDVAARATCPVLLVRADADLAAPVHAILLAIEGIAGSDSLLAVTADLAKSLKAKVVVVHASYPRGEDLERSLYHALRTHGEQAVAAAVAKLRRSGVDAGEMTLTTRSGISRALATCADSIGAGLIVIGAHSPNRVGEGAGTDLSMAVSRRTTRPVLVTRER